jgi:hypothetical protein
MAISLKHPEIKPIDVLKKASELHHVPKDDQNYWIVVDGITIPIGSDMDPTLSSISVQRTSTNPHPTSEYNPVISAQRGYDHRGSERLFNAFGVEAKKLGDITKKVGVEELEPMIKASNVFMASVNNSVTPWMGSLEQWGPSSHVVLITDIVNIDGQSWYHILDPYSPNGEPVKILRPTKSFHQVEFRGYGTVIKTKEI